MTCQRACGLARTFRACELAATSLRVQSSGRVAEDVTSDSSGRGDLGEVVWDGVTSVLGSHEVVQPRHRFRLRD